MSERPLNERPAARPTKPKAEETSQAESPQYVAPTSFWSSLGCFGWSLLIALAIVVISAIGAGIQGAIQNSQMSHGSETYDVTPETVDPRSTFQISAKCDAGMAASAADPTENGEKLLKETGNLCSSQEEWEAALYKYPRAIGIVDAKFLDGSEFNLLCGSYPEVKICRNKN